MRERRDRGPSSSAKPRASRGPGQAPAAPARGAAPRPEAPIPQEAIDELIHEVVRGPVKVLFLDVDGTMTDGSIVFTADGGDARRFFIRDGIALKWARDLGVTPVAISGRASRAVDARMDDLGIEYHGGIEDKVEVARQALERLGASWEQSVMVGDDLPDVALLRRVGWPIAVADAVPEVRAVARTVTGKPAGRGAVREVVEMVLRHNGTWDQVLARYGATS
jgi:3-deoxy-D-manno-octulosonate 8-phosphate phosphatase (KDO 8-P phosphatase)